MSDKTELDEHGIELLIEEYRQAWSHYRHLEGVRERYLNFFFTLLLAVLGLGVTLIGLQSGTFVINHWNITGVLLIIWILSLLATYLFAATRKLGVVLEFYERMKDNIRPIFYKDHFASIYPLVSIRAYDHPLMKIKFFRAQNTTERIFAGGAILSTIVLGLGVLLSFINKLLQLWELGIINSLFIILFIIQIRLIRWIR